MVEKGEESFDRVSVAFGGLADLMDRFERKLAGNARIPQTRWSGQSPVGMNATGDSDMSNYVLMFEAQREHLLPEALLKLDEVLARDAGLAGPLEYEFPSLLSIDPKVQAETSKIKAEAVAAGLDAGVFDEDEARVMLDGDETFGNLPGTAPELPEPEVVMMPGGDPNAPPVMDDPPDA